MYWVKVVDVTRDLDTVAFCKVHVARKPLEAIGPVSDFFSGAPGPSLPFTQ